MEESLPLTILPFDRFAFVPGHCCLLPFYRFTVATGRHWSPLVATGRHWSPLVATGRHWSPLVASTFYGFTVLPFYRFTSALPHRSTRKQKDAQRQHRTFLIYRTCMRRAPAKPVRAFCESGVLFHMSHLKLHFTLHTSHCTLHAPHFM